MKRYVKELANDILAKSSPFVRKGTHRHPREKEILRIVELCQRGMITSYEAAKLLIETDEESASKEESWAVDGNETGKYLPIFS